jgi:hypothetical protein
MIMNPVSLFDEAGHPCRSFGFASIIRAFCGSILKSEAVGKGAPTFAFRMLDPAGACPGSGCS